MCSHFRVVVLRGSPRSPHMRAREGRSTQAAVRKSCSIFRLDYTMSMLMAIPKWGDCPALIGTTCVRARKKNNKRRCRRLISYCTSFLQRPCFSSPLALRFTPAISRFSRMALQTYQGPEEEESARRRTYFWGCVLLVASGLFFVMSL